jgi:hypothetical protein
MIEHSVARTDRERAVLGKHLEANAQFTGMLRLYAATHRDLRNSLKRDEEEQQQEPPEEFREQRRRKRNPSDEHPTAPKKIVPSANSHITTRNFFASLRTANMDTDSAGTEANMEEKADPGKTGRPPPIILTSTVNLIHLQKQLQNVHKDEFELSSTRNGTRVVTNGMADFEAVKTHFTNNNLSYFSFFLKSQKPVKARIRHLPRNTPAEDISDGLVNRGFDVISVKQITTTRRSPIEEATTGILPLFPITLPMSVKSQEVFKLSSLCHISIIVEVYRAQIGLTQYHNC